MLSGRETAEGWEDERNRPSVVYNEDYAQIGITRSADGICGWERHPQNPVIAPDPGAWDSEACYKPYAVYDGEKWMLWYNGRTKALEQIGVAVHQGYDLGFYNI